MAIDSYKLVKKVLIQTHNTRVAEFFTHPYNRDKIDTAESAARNACIIRSKDAANVILLKLGLFNDVFNRQELIATAAEAWNPKPLQNVPQLAIYYRPKDKVHKREGTTRIVVPHYIGGRYPQLPHFHRGSRYGIRRLTDNSQLQITAKSFKEAERVMAEFTKLVNHTMLQEKPRFGYRGGTPVKVIEIYPYFCDHYPHGMRNNKPSHRDYLEHSRLGGQRGAIVTN